MYSGKKAQHDFPKMRGGGPKAVWNFSKNSSVLVAVGFPYLEQHFRCLDKPRLNWSWLFNEDLLACYDDTIPKWGH